MQYRTFGRTGWQVSAIGFGAWAIGSSWGHVDRSEALAALHRAVDLGINFFDTADVYGSEPLLGQLRHERREPILIATKCGMRVNPDPRGYNRRNLTLFVDQSLKNLQTETIDLLQLHCPPIKAYNAEVFGILDDLTRQGKVRYYGVSVERIDEARQAIEFAGVQSVQMVFNIFRQRPADEFFADAQRRGVSIVARVPLASGLLTGKLTRASTFAPDDHRSFNRNGEAFDRGETFAGVDFETGLQAVEELRPLTPAGATLSQMALRWILMHDAVACAIPGGKRPSQVEDNARAADLPPLSAATMAAIRDVYDRRMRAQVHELW
jgi:aryl-alcohol dehydrogenase-like predicted oxidoreductase